MKRNWVIFLSMTFGATVAHATALPPEIAQDAGVLTYCNFHSSFDASWAFPTAGDCQDRLNQLATQGARTCVQAAYRLEGLPNPFGAPVVSTPPPPAPTQNADPAAFQQQLDQLSRQMQLQCVRPHPNWALDSECMNACVNQVESQAQALIASTSAVSRQYAGPTVVGPSALADPNSLIASLQNISKLYQSFPGGAGSCDMTLATGLLKYLGGELDFLVTKLGGQAQSGGAMANRPGDLTGVTANPAPQQSQIQGSPQGAVQGPESADPAARPAQSPVTNTGNPENSPLDFSDPNHPMGYFKQPMSQSANVTVSILPYWSDHPDWGQFNHGATIGACMNSPQGSPACKGFQISATDAQTVGRAAQAGSQTPLEQMLQQKLAEAGQDDQKNRTAVSFGTAIQKALGDLPMMPAAKNPPN
jgi:hypothetical protein